MLKVLYILSHARSGSTILDILLGNHPQIVSTGELSKFYRFAFLDPQYCSCGQPVAECSFWSSVTTRLHADQAVGDISRQNQLQNTFERYRYWPLRAFHPPTRRRAGQYRRQLLGHYQAIAEASGKNIIVDSSKNGLRALRLSEMAREGQVDARFLFLVRDGRGIVWSFKKQMARQPEIGRQKDFKKKSTLRTTLSWLLANSLCEHVIRKVPSASTFRMRYEDLCSAPEETLTRLAAWAEVDPDPLADALQSDAGLEISHLVAGSRHRMAGQIRFRPDQEWRGRWDTTPTPARSARRPPRRRISPRNETIKPPHEPARRYENPPMAVPEILWNPPDGCSTVVRCRSRLRTSVRAFFDLDAFTADV